MQLSHVKKKWSCLGNFCEQFLTWDRVTLEFDRSNQIAEHVNIWAWQN